MFLSPSKILYTHNEHEFNASAERTFKEMTKTVHMSTVFPKLQVVKKDGFYFTLNDAKLQVYRYLEKLGKCGSVEVETISLKNVPDGIKSLMKAPNSLQVFKVHKSNDNQKRGKYRHISMTSCSEKNTDSCVDCSKCCHNIGDKTGVDNDDSSASENSEADSSDWSDEDDSSCDDTESSEDDDEDKTVNESEIHKSKAGVDNDDSSASENSDADSSDWSDEDDSSCDDTESSEDEDEDKTVNESESLI